MTTSAEIKKLARLYEADLCGIAPVERFENAPKGFHPQDIYDGAKSVIVLAVREPKSTFHSKSPVPYTFTSEVALNKVSKILLALILELEKRNVIAIPVPSEPYEYWDKESMTGKGILSLKHAGHLAGLGAIGRNTLLVNRKYGNLIRLGAIITNVILEGDPMEKQIFCDDSCSLCMDTCPAGAIENNSVSQKKCRPHSGITTEKGYSLYVCHNCRKVCPSCEGFDDSESAPLELSKILRVKFEDSCLMK
jgi:epoxyqueuosine reductase QueG